MINTHPVYQEDRKVVCPICKVSNSSIKKTKAHIYIDHFGRQKPTKNILQCLQCDKEFAGATKLKDHVKNVHTERNVVCPKCGKKFKTGASLITHMKTHEENREILCPHCPHLSAGQRALKLHIERIHNLKPQVCDECGKTCQNEVKMREHRKTHVKQEVLLCPYFACQKLSNGRVAQIFHLKRVHGPKLRNHPCSYCAKMFTTPRLVQKHENTVHLNVRTLKCDQCDFSTNYSGSLGEHKAAAHDGVMFDCDHPGCNKSYNARGNLYAHRWRVHKIPRPNSKF